MSKSFMLQAIAGRIIEVHKDLGQEGEAEGTRCVCAWVMLQMIILILYSTFPRCERCSQQCRRLFGPRDISKKEIQLYLLGSPCTVWSSNINFQSESIVICLFVSLIYGLFPMGKWTRVTRTNDSIFADLRQISASIIAGRCGAWERFAVPFGYSRFTSAGLKA